MTATSPTRRDVLAAPVVAGAVGLLPTEFAATGDDTIRTSVYDVVNGRAWPTGYTSRVVENGFVGKRHGHEADLARAHTGELEKVRKATASGVFETANATVGESIGPVHDIPTAGEIVQRVAAEAAALFGKFAPAQIAA